MNKILLDYFFPVTTVEPLPAASTAFLKQVCIVVNPNGGGSEGDLTMCTSMAQVAAVTDNLDAQQLFDAGMNRVFVLQKSDLNLASILNSQGSQFFTVLVSSDFDDEDVIATQASLVKGDLTFTAVVAGYAGNNLSIEFLDTVSAGSEVATLTGNKISVVMEGGVSTATQLKAALDANPDILALMTTEIAGGESATAQAAFAEDSFTGGDGLTLGSFSGVVGISSTDDSFLSDQSSIQNRVAFKKSALTPGSNMFFAFGKLLGNPLTFTNQQYINMPFSDGINDLGDANNYFDERISFVIDDAEFGSTLGFFVVGGKAIIAPYIKRNLEIDLQSQALTYVSANQPAYTRTQAALLEDELQKVVDSYIDRGLIETGSAEVRLEQSNFVASGYFTISEPNAMWRMFGQIRQTT